MKSSNVTQNHLTNSELLLRDCINIGQLAEKYSIFSEVTELAVRLFSAPGNEQLIATGCRDICTKFHRGSYGGSQLCRKCEFHDEMNNASEVSFHRCNSGLIEAAIPVTVFDRKIATLTTGQIFTEQPDVEIFTKQAKKLGYDLNSYLTSLKEVPVTTKKKIEKSIVFLRDMTALLFEQRLARLQKNDIERTLTESEEHFRTAFNSIGDAVIVTDTSGQITTMNPVAEKLTGWKNEAAVGTSLENVFVVINSETRKEDENPVERVLRTGKMIDFTNHTALVSKDGTEYQIANSAAPIRNDNGLITGVALVFRDVTETYRMQTQIAKSAQILKQNVAQLNSIINALPGLVTVVDTEFNVLVANDAVRERFGQRTMSEVIGQKCHKTRKGIDAPCPQCGIVTALKTGDVFSRISTPEEEKLMGIATKAYAIPLMHEDGTPWGGVEVIMDVSDIRRTEKSLRESEERMQLALQGADLGLWDWNPTTGDVTFDERWAEMLGYRLEEIEPKVSSWKKLVHPDDMPRVMELLNRHLDGKTPIYETEHRLRTKNGNWKWILARGKVLERDELGRPIRATGTHLDISDRKMAEAEVYREKERLNITLRSIGDGVITTDTQGLVTMMNGIAENLTCWRQEDAIGRRLETVFHIVDEFTKEPCENPVLKVLSTQRIMELSNHTCLIARDGTERVIADSGAPIRDHSGNIIGVVLVFRDVTEKSKVDATIQRAAKMDSLGVLAGGIAHDFNNLLGGIYGYLDLAIDLSKDKDLSLYLSKATNTIDRARGLTQQLLTFAKGGTPVKKDDNLFPFVEETATFALSGSNVSCVYDVQKDLWSCCFDKNQIGQVIDNIVINAQQSMPDGGTTKISARNIMVNDTSPYSLPTGNYVRISIKDHGTGIHNNILPRIFDPFFTTKTKGHGLGLATCYSIVNRHGGCIDVETKPNRGTTFHIVLPAAKELTKRSTSTSSNRFRGSGTFLIMDDEPVIREIIGRKAESLGYRVVCCETGVEAVEFFVSEMKAGRKIAAAILDLTVPGNMGGKEAVAEIRKWCSQTPVFVASGYAEDPVMATPEQYGFTASICKPFRMKELVEILATYVSI